MLFLADQNKSNLYPIDDLQQLLSIHQILSDFEPGFREKRSGSLEDKRMRSLQDLVEETVGQQQNHQQQRQADRSESSKIVGFESSFDPEQLKVILPRIRAIVSDVDGTLLTSRHTLLDSSASAIKEAVECAFSPVHALKYFFLATGKTRAGALRSLGPEVKALLEQTPGVFCQGLYCVDARGNVVYEQKLESNVIPRAEALALECGTMLLCYDGDLLFAANWTAAAFVNTVAARYGEPTPQIVKTVLQDHHNGFHKMLFLHDDMEFVSNIVRPRVEALAVELGCEVTQAVPTMLELLPKGCSKARGVQKLCEHLGIDVSKEVCSIGDAENDLGMLLESAIGIAVGNAKQNVKDAADIVMTATNDDGAAGTAIELFGLGKLLQAAS
jgi:Cof subfamily protein (haloacid dehalogenase superfamily)